MVQKQEERIEFQELLLKSLVAWTLIAGFVASRLSGGSVVFAGVCILGGAMLAMNSLGRLDHLLHLFPKMNGGLVSRIAHRITGEGELAGILVGVIAGVVLAVQGQWGSVHIRYSEALTLFGIMSVANMTARHVIPIMAWIERCGGKKAGSWLVVTAGSLLSSITTEAAAAVFLSEYLKKRVAPGDRGRMAVGLAAAIGSGGGLLPFAAPPVLIVWGTLHATLGWGIGDLILLVGGGCVLHVVLTAFLVRGIIQPRADDEHTTPSRGGALPLLLLGGLVAAHVFIPGRVVYAVDALVGLWNIWLAHRQYRDCPEHVREEAFTAKWKPLIFGVLLVALEVIGVAGDPAIAALAKFIPSSWPLWAVGLVLFWVTATVSHVADNALASRVLIPAAIELAKAFQVSGADDFLAACVLMGALFGGFLLIAANIPNFVIAAIFGVSAAEWWRSARRLYATIAAYVVWIGALAAWMT